MLRLTSQLSQVPLSLAKKVPAAAVGQEKPKKPVLKNT
jgi:hypothetical protein